MESQVREKLFEPDEKAALDAALMSACGEAFKAPDATVPASFTKGMLNAIMGAIVESTKAVVVRATKCANGLQKTIDDLTVKCARQAETVQYLERRASRHAEHLKSLEDRVQKLEHR